MTTRSLFYVTALEEAYGLTYNQIQVIMTINDTTIIPEADKADIIDKALQREYSGVDFLRDISRYNTIR